MRGEENGSDEKILEGVLGGALIGVDSVGHKALNSGERVQEIGRRCRL
jgi:hypothetical protein